MFSQELPDEFLRDVRRMAAKRLREGDGRVLALAMKNVVADFAKQLRASRRKPASPGSGAPGRDSAGRLVEIIRLLKKLDSRIGTIARLKIFGDLGNDEIAGILKISTQTVERDWHAARAWLRDNLGDDPGNETSQVPTGRPTPRPPGGPYRHASV